MQLNDFDYFYDNENEQYLFAQLPLMLIKDDRFDGLPTAGTVLYSLFLDRTKLSAKNNWRDEEGRVYIIYTHAEMQKDLRCWQKKISRAMKALKEFGLIKVVRRGLKQPNLIYVMNFATAMKYSRKEKKNSETPQSSTDLSLEQIKNCPNDKSRIVLRANQELSLGQTINTNQNQTDLIQTDFNQSVKDSTKDKEIAEVKETSNDRLTDSNTQNFIENEKLRSALGNTENEKVGGLPLSQHQTPNGTNSNAEAQNIKESSVNYAELKKWNSENIGTLTRELMQNGGDLSIFASDPSKMHAVVNAIIDTSCTPNAQNNHVYGIVKQAVTQILCSTSPTIKVNKDNFMRYSDVLAKFSEFTDTSGDTVRFKWLAPFIEQFAQKLPKYEPTVKNRVPYAKASALHYLYLEYDDKASSRNSQTSQPPQAPVPANDSQPCHNNDSSPAPANDSQPSFNRYYEEFDPCEYAILTSMRPEFRSETINARIAELKAFLNR